MIGHLAAWLLTYAVHSTIVVAVAIVAIRFIRSAALRDVLCRIALIGALLTTTIQQVLPTRAAFGTIAIAPLRSVEVATVAEQQLPIEMPASEPRSTPVPSWPAIAVGAWGSIASLLLTRLLVRRRRLLSSFGARRETVSGEDLVLLNLLRERAGMDAPIRLTTSDALSSPVAMQTAEICVPRDMFAALSADQKEAILAHELAHLRRRDPLWLMLSEGLKAIFFFQPLTRVLQKQMRESAEFLCDDFALLHTGKPKALAETLGALASRLQHDSHELPVAAMAESASRLIERVSRVLRLERAPEKTLNFAPAASIGLIVIALGALLAPGVSARVTEPAAQQAVAWKAAPLAPVITQIAHAEAPRRISQSAPAAKPRKSSRSTETIDHEIVVDNGTLSQHDDVSRTTLTAHYLRMKTDASEIRFLKPSGWLEVVQQRTGGERHVLKARPAGNGSIAYSHTVDDVSRPWDGESRAIVADAFRKRSHLLDEREVAARTWSGVQEITGTSDGVEFRYSIRGQNVAFEGNRVVEILPRGSITIEEEVDGRFRSAYIAGAGREIRIGYRGDWSGVSDEERDAWLEHYLALRTGKNASLFKW